MIGCLARRCISTASDVEPMSEILAYQNNLFDKEQKRQKESVGRIEKIVVKYNGVPENVTLSMNRGLSTPYHCAKRMKNLVYSDHYFHTYPCNFRHIRDVGSKEWIGLN